MIKKYAEKKNQIENLSLTYSTGKRMGELIKDYKISNMGGSHKKKFSRDEIITATERISKSQLVEVSRYFYSTNPLYTQYINYYSTIFPYYWAVFPKMQKKKSMSSKSIDEWFSILSYVEMINPELTFIEIARRTLINGACYIAIKDSENRKDPRFGIQFLPTKFCRSNKKYKGRAVVDFNVTYFEQLSAVNKAEALKTFPAIVVKAYRDYEKKKSKGTVTLEDYWQSLDVDYSYKFSLREDDLPLIFGVVLDLLDLQDAKDITMFKVEQEISKILVQKFGVDNQGQTVVTLPELQEFQRDTSSALASIPGMNVMTTYADVSVESLQKATASSGSDTPITQIGQDSYESAGVSAKLISSDNAGTLGKSIILNESIMRYLLLQLREFLQIRLDTYVEQMELKTSYSIEMPDVSRFNWKEKFDVYINANSLFSSKLMAQIISGRRESDIVSAYYFEESLFNDGSEATDSAATSSSETSSNTDTGTSGSTHIGGSGNVGRPELPDDQKSEKTLQNRESI